METTGPLWRLLAVACAFGSLFTAGYYLNAIHRAEDFATLATITIAFTMSFWSRLHPDRLVSWFGPFGRIVAAIAASHEDLRTWVRERTLLAGVLAAVCYGLLVILGKHAVLALMHAAWSPWLAASVGLAVGAVVVAPEVFTTVSHRRDGGAR